MSFISCIMARIDERAIPQHIGRRIIHTFDDAYQRLSADMNPVDAEARAMSVTLEAIQKNLEAEKAAGIKHALMTRKMLDDLKADFAKRQVENNSIKEMLFGNLVKDVKDGASIEKVIGDVGNIPRGAIAHILQANAAQPVKAVLEKARETGRGYANLAKSTLSDVIYKYGSTHFGVRQNVDDFVLITKELLGGKKAGGVLSDEAKRIREVFDLQRDLLEQAGAVIGKVKNFFPVVHDYNLIRKSSFEEWFSVIQRNTDFSNTVDKYTGLALTPARFEEICRDIYDNISTNGMKELHERVELGLSSGGKGKSLYRQYEDGRFFQWKDADAFIEYNRLYGNDDAGLFFSLMEYIDTTSRDIGILRVMGSKPSSMFGMMEGFMKENNALDIDIRHASGMYETLTGKASGGFRPGFWFNSIYGLKSVFRMSHYGKAVINSLPDIGNALIHSRYAKIPALDVLRSYLKSADITNPSHQRMLEAQLFFNKTALGASYETYKNDAEMLGSKNFRKLENTFHRLSGLQAHTNNISMAGQHSVALVTAEWKHANTGWADVPQEMKDVFEDLDIGEVDFENWKKADFFQPENSKAQYIRPEEIAKVDIHSAAKYAAWLTRVGDTLSQEPNLYIQAITNGTAFVKDLPPNSFARMALSLVAMGKAFPFSNIYNHLIPALNRVALEGKYDRLTAFMASSTLLGLASMEINSYLSGLTPPDLSNPKVWIRAMMVGGAFGIYGDFLFAAQDDKGRDLFTRFLGGGVNMLFDIWDATWGSSKSVLFGEDKPILAREIRLINSYLPFQNLWYMYLPLHRGMLDQLERMADPQYDSRIKRYESKLQKNTGQKLWWKPAHFFPEG